MLLSEPVLPSLSVYPEHLFPKAFCAIAHPSELAVLSATGWERRPEMLTHATLISPRHYPQGTNLCQEAQLLPRCQEARGQVLKQAQPHIVHHLL